MAKKTPKKPIQSTSTPSIPSNYQKYLYFMDTSNSDFTMKTPEDRSIFCQKMYAWAYKEDALDIMRFCMQEQIPYGTFYDWTNKFPDDVGKTYKEVKRIIASNRKQGAYIKKLDGYYIFRDMHRYDPEWKPEVDEYHANLKKEDEIASAVYNILMNKPHVKDKEELKKEIEGIRE